LAGAFAAFLAAGASSASGFSAAFLAGAFFAGAFLVLALTVDRELEAAAARREVDSAAETAHCHRT
jgi:hypothetical protein